ncbi:MAG: hypothetical protein FD138_1121 [Planctomycetota bacterium]|nr:MAG: hypothetical protein FD138_1121 [Planctomycetota bacterium]
MPRVLIPASITLTTPTEAALQRLGTTSFAPSLHFAENSVKVTISFKHFNFQASKGLRFPKTANALKAAYFLRRL